MCKYCKNLKRIKDLDEKEFLSTIEAWKKRCKELEQVLLCFVLQEEDFPTPFSFSLVNDAKAILAKNWIRR